MAAAHAPAAPAAQRRLVLGVAALTALAALLRTLYARHVGTNPLVGDGLEFHLAANLLADGRGFVDPFAVARGVVAPTADKPPLYTLTLAGLSALGLRSPGEHHVSGVVTGTLLVPVVAALAHAVTRRAAVALLAAGLCAAYPSLVIADGSLRSESLFALGTTLAVLAAVRYRARPALGWALVGAAAAALAALTRGEGLLLVGLVPLAVGRGRPGASRRHLAGALAVAALLLAPWLVRCWTTFDQPVLISTNSGGLVAGANCADTYERGGLFGEWSLRCLELGRRVPGEPQTSAALRRKGTDYARAHAGRLPVVLAARAGRTTELFRPGETSGQQAFFEGADLTLARVAVPAFWLVALLAAAALALGGVPPGTRRLLLLPAVMTAGVTLVGYGWMRFRVGAEPCLLVLAAAGLVAVLDRARSRPRHSSRRGRLSRRASGWPPAPSGPGHRPRAPSP